MFLQVATEACQLTVLKTITTNPGRNWPIWGLYMSPFKMSKTRPCIFPFASWGHTRLEACIPKAIPGGEVWSAGTQQAPAAKIRCYHLNSVFDILQSFEPALTCWQEWEPSTQSPQLSHKPQEPWASAQWPAATGTFEPQGGHVTVAWNIHRLTAPRNEVNTSETYKSCSKLCHVHSQQSTIS